MSAHQAPLPASLRLSFALSLSRLTTERTCQTFQRMFGGFFIHVMDSSKYLGGAMACDCSDGRDVDGMIIESAGIALASVWLHPAAFLLLPSRHCHPLHLLVWV